MFKGVEPPKNEEGRYYHIDCGPGDIHPYILTCGCSERAEKIAGFFDRHIVHRENREFSTYTGFYKDIPITVIGTGIGPDNTAIVVVEASQCVPAATFIRIGSSGGLQDYISIGDLIITERALRDEGTSHYYAPPDVVAEADSDGLFALKKAAQILKYPHHIGITCTTSDFYAGQGWLMQGFSLTDPGKIQRMRKSGVLNFEMEMSVYFTLAKISSYKLRACGVTAVYDNIINRKFPSKKVLHEAEEHCMKVGLLALEILYAKDNGKEYKAANFE